MLIQQGDESSLEEPSPAKGRKADSIALQWHGMLSVVADNGVTRSLVSSPRCTSSILITSALNQVGDGSTCRSKGQRGQDIWLSRTRDQQGAWSP